MREQKYTPEQVGRMTLMDLVVFGHDRPPSPRPTGAGLGPMTSEDQKRAMKQRIAAARARSESWEE